MERIDDNCEGLSEFNNPSLCSCQRKRGENISDTCKNDARRSVRHVTVQLKEQAKMTD